MTDWSHIFVSRERELDELKEAYRRAADGETTFVAIIGDAGFGKTRLIQEFYHWLATKYEGGHCNNGYWPDQRLNQLDNLCINPDADKCGVQESRMPYFWWGLRLADPGSRKQVTVSALATERAKFDSHFGAYEKFNKQKTIGKDAVGGLAGTVTDSIIPGYITARKIYKSYREKSYIDNLDHQPAAVQQRERDTLIRIILTRFFHLAKKPPKGFKSIPLVIVVDDAQWLAQDVGMETFVSNLLHLGRTDSWPLLVVMACREKEWRESIQTGGVLASFCDQSQENVMLSLPPATRLEKIIDAAFPGLTAEQRQAIVAHVDGNPRFLKEVLHWLQQNKRHFVNRDLGAALTDNGIKEIANREFPDFIVQRFNDAPEYIQQALALASTQGMTFSSRIVEFMFEHLNFKGLPIRLKQRDDQYLAINLKAVRFSKYLADFMAENLNLKGPSIGLKEGDDPYSFITLKNDLNDGEFRIKPYHSVAFENQENHWDIDDVKQAQQAVQESVVSDVKHADERELEWVFDTGLPEQAHKAAVALIDVANTRHDPRTAGTIAKILLERNPDLDSSVDLPTILACVDAYVVWYGPEQPIIELLEHRLAHNIKHLSPVTEHRIERATLLLRLGNCLTVSQGAEAARPVFEECLKLARTLADQQNTPIARHNLSVILFKLATVMNSLEGPKAARPLLEESLNLARILADQQDMSLASLLAGQQDNSAARHHLSGVISDLADVIHLMEGPRAARSLFEERLELARALANEQNTPDARRSLSIALSEYAEVIHSLMGPEKARPLFEETLNLDRTLAEDQGTPLDRHNLSVAISKFADVVKDIDGPEETRSLREESLNLARDLVAQHDTLPDRRNLISCISKLADVIEAIEGPTESRSLREESLVLARNLVEEQNIPDTRHILSDSLSKLADVIMALERPNEARPLFEESLKLNRDLNALQNTPDTRRELCIALSKVADVIYSLEGPTAARPIFEESLVLARDLAQKQNTFDTRHILGTAISKLADVIKQIEGPMEAYSLLEESLKLRRDLADEQNTPEFRRELSISILSLAYVTEELGRLEAARILYEENLAFARDIAEKQNTHDDQLYLALSFSRLANLVETLGDTTLAHTLHKEGRTILRAALSLPPL